MTQRESTPTEPAGAHRPRVSVVLPTHNRSTLLPRAIETVLAQTMGDLELVVVDDGSTDDTASVRTRFTDPRLVWVDGPHRGVSTARNLGAGRARGDWVVFLDDDDEWHPEFLARQLATAAATGAEVVYSLGVTVDALGRPWDQDPPPSPDPLVASTWGWHPYTHSILVQRSAFWAAGGFPAHLVHGEDQYVWVRLALDRRWAVTPAPLTVCHAHGGPRLSDDATAYRRASAELDGAFGRAVEARLGWRAAARWFWEYRGRAEVRGALADGRREAARAIVGMLGALPRSAPTIARLLLVVLLGPGGYARVHGAYVRVRTGRAG